MKSVVAAIAAFAGLALSASAGAHEFWISPDPYAAAIGERVVLRLRVGEKLKGDTLRYNPAKFNRFTTTMDSGTFELSSRLGDDPAASYVAQEPRLHVIAYQAKPERIDYADIRKFKDYLAYEGLTPGKGNGAVARQARDAPFAETYTRYAKALVQVGPVTPGDSDVPLSLAYELIAQGNPYDGGESIAVAFLAKGTRLAGAPVALFCKTGTVKRTMLGTDERGEVQVPLGGCDEYLLNAVQIEGVEAASRPAESEAVPVRWHSHWASLSFGGR